MKSLRVGDEIKEKNDHEILMLSVSHPDVFSVIVDRYQRAFIDKVTGILRNREEAYDVVQDTFVKIYVNAHRFKVQEGASFRSWAYKILLNTCFSFCKKRKREREFMSRADDDVIMFIGTLDKEFERRINLDRFLSIVSKVPAAMARILQMAAIDGKSNKDIADAEHISLGAVRTRLHRARKEFKKAAIFES